jgi:hypothetical protein
MQYTLSLPSDGEERVAFIVCGSPRSESEAREIERSVGSRLAELKEEKRAHYLRLFQDTAVLDSPSYVFNKAFLWAKLGTEDFKHDDPRLGLLFFAGFPAYNFYFASDSMLILRGSLAFGDFEDARAMMRTIVRYQATTQGRDTLPGEIWHEMSTTGDRISPNFAGFLFPGLLREFHDWTGDARFLQEMYPHARAVIDWGFLMDTNGDGLLENGPEGEMADSASEDRNVERSHYHVQTQWLDALHEGVRLAGLVGDAESATRWQAAIDRLLPLVNRFYWNEKARYFEETLRPDGCLDTSAKGYPNLDPTMVDEGKAAATARLLLEEEAYLSDIESFQARKEFEKTFGTHRSYMSWYVIERGRRAGLLYKAHQPDPAYQALEAIAGSPFHWTTPGLWPEVWAVDEPTTLRARGCFHQAWTGSHGFLYPFMEGLLGLRPDAASHALTLDPHLPPHWPRLSLRRLRLGEGWFDLECEQGEGWRRLCVRNATDAGLTVTFGFALPLMVRLRELRINGKERDLQAVQAHQTPTDFHVFAEAKAEPGAECASELRWEPSTMMFEIASGSAAVGSRPTQQPVFLSRCIPGSTCQVEVQVRNNGFEQVRAELQLILPPDWARVPGPVRPLVLAPNEKKDVAFALSVPAAIAEGYATLRVRLLGDPTLLMARTAYLPVFRSLAPSIDARQVARPGLPYAVQVPVTNLSALAQTVSARIDWPADWKETENQAVLADLEPGQNGSLRLTAVPTGSGDAKIRVLVTCAAPKDEWQLSHNVRVVPREIPLVLYSGFLRCPLPNGDGLEVVNLPANYALRKPHVFSELLAATDLVLTSDQHDAVFAPDQIRALERFVHEGGRLLFFCSWSAPWGRGFQDTFGSIAIGRFPDMLPLRMRKGITHARRVRVTEEGKTALTDIAWDTIPPFDHNAAELRPGARLLAETEKGEPLIAEWIFGKGRVMAIAIDCFGFESYVEGLSFEWWPERPRMFRRGVQGLMERTARSSLP